MFQLHFRCGRAGKKRARHYIRRAAGCSFPKLFEYTSWRVHVPPGAPVSGLDR
ncbi:hypothetical protein GMO_13140 [Gluconobacter morbifer G707]|uniref:Uncharacterized protein n=1 Tax=Gluconobacter morbifer G707 TaxID=1088869 RepID=G6XIA4_9PROT|nr:hypothetical protein GMO_13140 [Gluconobacter morbifer G707]